MVKVTLTDDQIAESEELKKKLNPIEARADAYVSIQIIHKSDFLMLSAGKKTFYWKEEDGIYFFFVEEGIIYNYQIIESRDGIKESQQDAENDIDIAEKYDFSPCTLDEFLSKVYNDYTGETLEDQLNAKIKRTKQGKEWLTDNFFDEIKKTFDELVNDEVIDINNRIKEAEREISNCKGYIPSSFKRDYIIFRGFNHVQQTILQMINDSSEKIHKKGIDYKKDTGEIVRNELMKLNLKTLNTRQKYFEIDRLYKTYNPESKRDPYHLSKKDIEYIVDELMQQ